MSAETGTAPRVYQRPRKALVNWGRVLTYAVVMLVTITMLAPFVWMVSASLKLNRDVFARGAPEPIADIKKSEWSATLYDLLSAYAGQRQRTTLSQVRFKKREVWSLAEARETLERLIGQSSDWSRLDQYLIAYVVEPSLAPTVFASSFASALELVREGVAEIHQKESFAPIYMRKRVGVNGNTSTHDAQENG